MSSKNHIPKNIYAINSIIDTALVRLHVTLARIYHWPNELSLGGGPRIETIARGTHFESALD